MTTVRGARSTAWSRWSTCTPSPPRRSTATRPAPASRKRGSPAWSCAGPGVEGARGPGEELVAGLFGWANRTLEASADPLDVPWAWRVYAYRGHLLLQTPDRSLPQPR